MKTVKANEGLIKSLIARGIPHTIELTTNTTLVRVDHQPKTKYIISDSVLSFKDLGFITKVKKYAQGLEAPEVPYQRPNYTRYFDRQPGIYTDVVEIDVNSAYWEIAYQKQYISREIYEQGNTVPKMTRLIALGALATIRTRHRYDGKTYHPDGEDKNKVTRSYFFDVATHLGLLMSECLSSFEDSQCYFYWFDAFFVTRDAADRVGEFFRRNGLSCKRIETQALAVRELKRGWQLIAKQGEKQKPFFFSSGNTAAELIARAKKDAQELAGSFS